jgi:tetratricopeptide (TPR) repeat protein
VLTGLVLLAAVGAGESDLNPPELQLLLVPALDCVFRSEFDAAQQRLEQAAQEFPDNPLVHLFQGANWAVRIFDERSEAFEPSMRECLDRCEECARAALAQGPDPWAELAWGASLSCRAVIEGWRGNYWGTFRWGMQAPEHLRRAKETDPEFDEASLGLGIIEYFQYTAGRYMTGLKLFGSLGRALGLVDRSIENSAYFSTTARYVRAFILTQEGRYDEGWALLRQLLEEYPNSRLFLRLLRDSYVRGKEFRLGIEVAEQLGADAEQNSPGNVSIFADNWLPLARGHAGLGEDEMALAYCDSILKHDGEQGQVVGLKGYVRDARKLKARLRD